jgi:nucleotide-binding universal stress UspA family protein
MRRSSGWVATVTGHIVVGVTAHQPPLVLRQAARFARRFEALLVCAHVAGDYYVVRAHPDGSVDSRPIDPDQVTWENAVFDPGLAGRIQELAREEHVAVELRELAGETGRALSRLAEALDAEMIVVGSRHGGLRTSVHEFFSGSVAVHLAHRQSRPLVVVPADPVPEGTQLPWER